MLSLANNPRAELYDPLVTGVTNGFERSTFTGLKIGQKIEPKTGLFQLQGTILGIFSETLTNLTDMVWEISEDDDFETFSTFYD